LIAPTIQLVTAFRRRVYKTDKRLLFSWNYCDNAAPILSRFILFTCTC